MQHQGREEERKREGEENPEEKHYESMDEGTESHFSLSFVGFFLAVFFYPLSFEAATGATPTRHRGNYPRIEKALRVCLGESCTQSRGKNDDGGWEKPEARARTLPMGEFSILLIFPSTQAPRTLLIEFISTSQTHIPLLFLTLLHPLPINVYLII